MTPSWFPFLNEKSEPVALGHLTRTKDMGGGSGAAAAPDPHELMTGALIYKYGKSHNFLNTLLHTNMFQRLEFQKICLSQIVKQF